MNRIYKVVFFSCFVSLHLSSQNYNQVAFPHTMGGTTMCDALTIEQHTVHPGSIMVGYKAISPQGTANNPSYNFAIDRTGPNGLINQQNGSFQKAYQVHANMSDKCDPKTRPVLNSAGVSIIETIASVPSVPVQAHYAIAGAYSEGCYFGLLDAAGNCIYATSFLFPGKTFTNITQPKIMECPTTPGEYIVCGSMDKTMYAIRLNSQGVVLWNQLYPIEGEPRDMIASAYGPNKNNECIIVGKTDIDYANFSTDGFIMKLDISNGGVLLFKRLHMFNSNSFLNGPGKQYFNTIAVQHKEIISIVPSMVSTYGYFIGGYSEAFSSIFHGNLLLYNVDSSFTFLHLYIMTSLHDSTSGGEIVDITSRRVNNLNKHIYYHQLKLDSGMGVLRSDRTIGISSANFREFHYPALNGVVEGSRIGLSNNANSSNHGLHIYGTRNHNNTLASNFMTTYFNGVSTCSSFTNFPVMTQPASSHFTNTIIPYGNLLHCPNFYITATEVPGYVDLCGTADTIPGGDNSRTIYQAEEMALQLVNTKVFPNPSKNKVTVEYALLEGGSIRIHLQNILGQQVSVIEDTRAESGTYQSEFNLSALGLEKGIYLLHFEMAGERKTVKLIFEGE